MPFQIRSKLVALLLWSTLIVFNIGCTPMKSPPDWRYFDLSTNEVTVGKGRGQGKAIAAPELAKQYLEACQDGSGPACHRLGTLHVGGIGVTRNENRAKELFIQSCKLKDGRGCYAKENGPNRQDPRFIPVMGSWCNEGIVDGCVRLAIAFEEGEPRQHIPVDLERAIELYRAACALQHRPSCEHMMDVARDLDAKKSPENKTQKTKD
ncbi:MAG: sel1 repeat family protein [Deltaproteobacteria bacterium]|jgi:TPR repeat protein|nr:sel1 repeat family protein [Deltaproteobacteria bacterium]MBT6431693.1 sel1 repeat family protein [Deltaproteobacteria bacterium]